MPNPYATTTYVSRERWASLYEAVRTSLAAAEPAKEVLVVGTGPGLLEAVLARFDVKATSADVDIATEPDILADISDPSMVWPRTFPVVVALQILEHIPLNEISEVLRNLCRGLDPDGTLIVSLPQAGAVFRLTLKIPGVPELRIGWVSRILRRRPRSADHEWELGAGPIDSQQFAEMLRLAGGSTAAVRTWVVPENPFHRFYVLRRSQGSEE